MGAWEMGPFDNDDDGDWVFGFDDSPVDERLAFIDRAFAAVAGEADDGYIEMDTSTPAVAAAVVLAALVDPSYEIDSSYGPHSLAETRAADLTLDQGIRDRALAALDQVRGNGDAESEWVALWSEGGVLDQALAPLDTIAAVLCDR